jgi:hypothetical protein
MLLIIRAGPAALMLARDVVAAAATSILGLRNLPVAEVT